jgi:membrane protein implicated in regulation of membrane protease activity
MLWTCCTLSSVLTFLVVPDAAVLFVTKRVVRLVSSFVGKKERRKGEKERRKQRGIELILGMEAKDESDLDKEIVTVAIEGRDRTESK